MNARVASILCGLCLVVAVVAGVLWSNRGAVVRLDGTIQMIRTAPIDEKSSVLVADFRITNPADVAFVVRGVRVLVDTAIGRSEEGMTIAEIDARRMFAGIPSLGQKYNDSLIARERVPPGQQIDRMISARFEMPESSLEGRRRIRILVEEVDGAVTEIVERR